MGAADGGCKVGRLAGNRWSEAVAQFSAPTGSHRTPMMTKANETPAIDSVRITVTD